MAKKKLSEALAELGITADDLEDDELNLPISEVKKRLKANQEGYTKATQTVSEHEKLIQQYDTVLQQWKDHARGLEGKTKSLEQQIAERAEKVQAAGGDWRRDPLFEGLIGEFDGIVKEIKQSWDAAGALAKGMYAIADQYNKDKKDVVTWIDQAEQRFMKMDHPDFDADAVRAWAKENGVSDSWKNSYARWKASKLPDDESRIRKEERDKVLEELGDRAKPPVETEMGGGSRPPGPVGGDKPKDYNTSWGNLAKEFEKSGIGRS